MKTYLECIPCFFRQIISAGNLAKLNDEQQKKVIDEFAKILPEFSLKISPPEIARVMYAIISKHAVKEDIYTDIKKQSNLSALNIYHELKEKVNTAKEALLIAVELAMVGNIIDYGAKVSLNVEKELEAILNNKDRTILDDSANIKIYHKFKKEIAQAKNVLYLADNAGETVFDRILIEEIKKINPLVIVTYAVKERPIINDALYEDAHFCGIDQVAEVISSGSDAPATVLSLCSDAFLKLFDLADIVISKGQGNFEALTSYAKRPIFFMFMTKCAVIAKHVGNKIGDINLLYYTGE